MADAGPSGQLLPSPNEAEPKCSLPCLVPPAPGRTVSSPLRPIRGCAGAHYTLPTAHAVGYFLAPFGLGLGNHSVKW